VFTKKGIMMKLPEYDNRPSPGTPLYDAPSDKGDMDDIKFGFLVIALPLGTLLGFGAALVGLVDLLRSIFNHL
jgi:hypothetical protein